MVNQEPEHITRKGEGRGKAGEFDYLKEGGACEFSGKGHIHLASKKTVGERGKGSRGRKGEEEREVVRDTKLLHSERRGGECRKGLLS